jgi:hypothetical protein
MSAAKWTRWKGHLSVYEGVPKENTTGCIRGPIKCILEIDESLTRKEQEEYMRRVLRVPEMEAALRTFVEKYRSSQDCVMGCGLTNGDFFAAEKALGGAK